jgi:hypothetical protein
LQVSRIQQLLYSPDEGGASTRHASDAMRVHAHSTAHAAKALQGLPREKEIRMVDALWGHSRVCRMLLPKAQVGAFLGKGGSYIQDIRLQSNAQASDTLTGPLTSQSLRSPHAASAAQYVLTG